MNTVTITINDRTIEIPLRTTILEAARLVDIFIPTLCYHPDLPPAKDCPSSQIVYQGEKKLETTMPGEFGKGCGLCVVEVKGEPDLVGSCANDVWEGMDVTTDNDRIKAERQENLLPILARHPHACLTCAQQEGCSRTQCSTNVPETERCCPQFGRCELQNVAEYIGISDITPKWIPTDLPLLKEDPLYTRDYNLCIGCTRCVRVCRDLRGIEAFGFVFDSYGQIQVGTLGPTLAESGCKFCTACVEVCPTGALMDKSVQPGKKKEELVPCRSACPANIDVPEYVRLISQGKLDESNAVIIEKVPLPGILGRVCFHPCEAVCRRGEVNEPISICALKRYAADGANNPPVQVAEDTGKKIAVVGAGPAGLTTAFYLRKKGHAVTLFEAKDQAGGMMRYGIPAYRLPTSIVESEVDRILNIGIDFRPNHTLGKDFTIQDLKDDGHNAIFLGMGASLSKRIAVDGSDSLEGSLTDVLWGVEFLEAVARGKRFQLKDRVIVVGGGNVAVDVALTAKRCGAKTVSMICLECEEEMPAHEWEIEGAVAEGVNILPTWGPHRILSKGGRIHGMELVQCTCVFDEEGNFCPEFGDSRKIIEGDQIIMAVGQATNLSFLEADGLISIENGRIVVDSETLQAGVKGLYAGGDLTTHSGAIVHAIAAGRTAAAAIDKALSGNGDIEEVLFQRESPIQNLGRDENFATGPRERVPEIKMEARHKTFEEVQLGLTAEQARKEAMRCLQCDLRLHMRCNAPPPLRWLALDSETVQQLSETEGVFTLCDQDKHVLTIKGTDNLRVSLLKELEDNERAVWFEFEEDKMYTQRESELIQKYLQEFGEMPGGGDSDLDDLF